MLESKVQKDIQKLLDKRGAYVVKVISGNRRGIPDLLVCYKGQFLGFEVKTPTTRNKASPLQLKNIEMIRKANGIACVVWEVEQVEEILEIIERIDNDPI